MTAVATDRRRFVYHVDRDDVIVHVNDDWRDFARENGAAELGDTVLGRHLLEMIDGEETRNLYALVMGKVRGSRRAVDVPFRCDGPDVRRFMGLRIAPLADDGLAFAATIQRLERRAPEALLDPAAPRDERFLTVCSWCKCLRIDEDWVEVELAVARLRLFESAALPRLTHGICPACAESVLRQLENR